MQLEFYDEYKIYTAFAINTEFYDFTSKFN